MVDVKSQHDYTRCIFANFDILQTPFAGKACIQCTNCNGMIDGNVEFELGLVMAKFFSYEQSHVARCGSLSREQRQSSSL